MSDKAVTPVVSSGRKVRTGTLAVAPEIVGLNLAEPWRRLAAMILDLIIIGFLSLLSGPFLGIVAGVLLVLLLGNGKSAPFFLKIARWGCRITGVLVVLTSVFALGHTSFTHFDRLNMSAIIGPGESPAMKKSVFVPANASFGQLRASTSELQQQVDDLKSVVEAERLASATLIGRARALTGMLGVTFGWAGIYFTLLAGLLNGRTLGKFIFRIRAVKINGTPFTYFDGFIRQGGYVAGVALGMLGFLKLLWEPNRQAVEDRIAATVVVKV